STSPAIDKGKAVASIDQRGEPRPFNDPNIANAVGGDGSDIGAYEADLRLTKILRMTNDLQLSFTTILGKNYQLQSRSSLASGVWNALGAPVTGTGGVVQPTVNNAFTTPVQFYRVLETSQEAAAQFHIENPSGGMSLPRSH